MFHCTRVRGKSGIGVGLFEFDDLVRIYRIQRWEFWLSIVCFAGVAVFGAIHGIGLAVVLAVIEFLWDGWRPHSAVLGRVDHIKGYHDVSRYPEARRVPGLVLFRWDAPLFFANAELFRDHIRAAVAEVERTFSTSRQTIMRLRDAHLAATPADSSPELDELAIHSSHDVTSGH